MQTTTPRDSHLPHPLPTARIIQQCDGGQEAEARASPTAQFKTGRFFHVATTILVAVQHTAATTLAWIVAIGIQLESGTGIGIGIETETETGGIGAAAAAAGFWEGLEGHQKSENETGQSSLIACLRFEGRV